jgi:hypothetical protein
MRNAEYPMSHHRPLLVGLSLKSCVPVRHVPKRARFRLNFIETKSVNGRVSSLVPLQDASEKRNCQFNHLLFYLVGVQTLRLITIKNGRDVIGRYVEVGQ